MAAPSRNAGGLYGGIQFSGPNAPTTSIAAPPSLYTPTVPSPAIQKPEPKPKPSIAAPEIKENEKEKKDSEESGKASAGQIHA